MLSVTSKAQQSSPSWYQRPKVMIPLGVLLLLGGLLIGSAIVTGHLAFKGTHFHNQIAPFYTQKYYFAAPIGGGLLSAGFIVGGLILCFKKYPKKAVAVTEGPRPNTVLEKSGPQSDIWDVDVKDDEEDEQESFQATPEELARIKRLPEDQRPAALMLLQSKALAYEEQVRESSLLMRDAMARGCRIPGQ